MKNKKQKRKYKSRYKKYVAGGMYADNTVAAAGQGSPGTTANIVFDQSNPQILGQNLNYLDEIKNKTNLENEKIVSDIEQEDEQAEIDIENASLESQQQTDAIGSTIGAGLEAGKQTGLIDKKAGSLGIGDAINAYKNVKHAKNMVKGVKGFNQAKTAFDVGQRVKMGEDAYKMSQGLQNVKKSTDAFKASTEAMKTGKMTMQGFKTADELRQASTFGGTTLKGAELGMTIGKDGTMAATQATQAAATGSAIGSAVGSLAKNPNVYALAAQYGGNLIKKGADDKDATTWNRGEAIGDILGTAGKYAGYGATLGTIVPGVGNLVGAGVGAVIGAGVGTYQGLAGRGKARREESIYKEERQRKVDAHNTDITSNLLTANAKVRAGEMEQKTYSGYDLGRNVVAKYGGMRYGHGGMKMGMPRYGYAA